jgi:hypothetical protein
MLRIGLQLQTRGGPALEIGGILKSAQNSAQCRERAFTTKDGSLVFGLMINSSKATYETIDRNVHSYSTQIILLDRSLRTYCLGAVQARQSLKDYLAAAIDASERANQSPGSRLAEQRLATIGDHLAAIQPTDGYHLSFMTDAQRQYRQIVEQRWSLVEQSEGIVPTPLVVMLIARLTLIFASFGYRAPFNPVIAGMFVVSAGLMAASIYLVLDMDIPFAGAIQISDAPPKERLSSSSSNRRHCRGTCRSGSAAMLR